MVSVSREDLFLGCMAGSVEDVGVMDAVHEMTGVVLRGEGGNTTRPLGGVTVVFQQFRV